MMHVNVFTTILFVISLKCVESAKILFFSPIPAHSHQKMYKEVWNELARRGHSVFVVTPNPVFNKSMTNLSEYDISSLHEFQENQIKPEWKVAMFNKPTFLGMILRVFVIEWIAGEGMEVLYKHAEIKRLVSEHDYFDACVFEWFHPATAVYGHIFKCPTIAIGSNSLPTQMLDSVGNPIHPITAPEQDLPILRDEITFFQRVWSTFFAIFVRWHYHYILLPTEDARIRKYYGNDIPYLGILERNISLIILNRNPAFHRPIANLPNVVELGAVKYSRPVFKIAPELEHFLNSSSKGIVYFSLGATMQGTALPSKYLKILQNSFSKLPYNVLWKWEHATMPNKPSNVFIAKFLPQVYVLEHPNVKLFITQGGLQSTEEAIAAHKPIIGIPLPSDETTNVDTCVKYGMGKMHDLHELNEDKLISDILEIVNNPRFAENAKKLDELMRDQPQDGLEKAVWWIEFIIRHKGARHLRSIAVDLPWWQYLMLDVLGFLLGIILVIFFSIYLIIKLILRKISKIFCKCEDSKIKSD